MINIVIIGNSAAALSALESLRSHDPYSRITLISKEEGPAYSRVLLPYYLRKKVPYSNLFIRSPEYYRLMKVETHFGNPVRQIDIHLGILRLEDGTVIDYDRLLIATGACPVMPRIHNLAGPGVFHLWTLRDAENIEPLLCPGKRALILGSGFVALQAAWAAKSRGLDVTIFELMQRIMPKALDEQGARVLHRRIAGYGVDVYTGIITEGIDRKRGGGIKVFPKGYPSLDADIIIVAAGVHPNIEFIENTGIEMDRGILVGQGMESSVQGIYAAGDVASGPTFLGEAHAVHALWPTAVEHGKIAGANMAGKESVYRGSLNMNVAEMFGITVASMGLFQYEKDLEEYQHSNPGNGTYLKVLLRNRKPVGAVLLGSPEDVNIFGALRPLILRKTGALGGGDLLRDVMENKVLFRKLTA